MPPEFERIEGWAAQGLGEVSLFKSRNTDRLVIEKKMDLGRSFGANQEEIKKMEARIMGLPEEITLASSVPLIYDIHNPVFSSSFPPHSVFFDFSSVSLLTILEKLRSQGRKIPEVLILACFGLLLGVGAFLEDTMEFHKGVCLQNILLIEGEKLQLINPYLMEGYVKQVIEVGYQLL